MSRLEIPTDRPPVYVSAGVNKEELQIVRTGLEETIALQIDGAFSEPECYGNDESGRKNVFWWDEETQAAYNSVGLKNPGRKKATEYLPRAVKAAKEVGQLVVIQIVSLIDEDPFAVLPGLAEWALEMGADAVEIDGSCRNQDPAHPSLCEDIEQSYALFDSIRDHVGQSAILGYKVSALPSATIRRFNTEKRLAVDFIDTINSVGNQPSPINPDTDKPAIEVNGGLAGQSGPAIAPLARRNLEWWLGFDEDLSIPDPSGSPFQLLSTGGVAGGEEVYYRTHHMGADLAGGTQAFCRTSDTRRLAQRWAQEYVNAAA